MPKLLKVNARTKRLLETVDKEITETVGENLRLKNKKNDIVAGYAASLQERFQGKMFHLTEQYREGYARVYLVVTKVGAPYLVDKDTMVTCHLKCNVLTINVDTIDKKVQHSVHFSADNGYYAHTDMTEISRVEYKKVHREAVELMEKSLGQF